jgi:hypothetical protein
MIATGLSYILPRRWQPHAGQTIGVKFLLEHACAGLLADPGVGKTSIVYGAFKVLRKRRMAQRMLVIAPLRPAYNVWPGEIEKWQDFNDLRVVVLHGPQKEELWQEDADVYVINYEGLNWLLNADVSRSGGGRASVAVNLDRLKAMKIDILVIDELSKMADSQGVRFKMLKQAIPFFGRRWGLTGSPAANGLMKLFGECLILDLGRTFGPYITKFRNEYFLPSFNGFGWNLKAGAEDRIYERAAPLMCRLAAEDYIDMPEVLEIDIPIDLPRKVWTVYKDVEEWGFAKIGERKITAANSGALFTKLSQIANGGIYREAEIADLLDAQAGVAARRRGERDWTFLHDEKTDALEELVESLQDEPLLVAYDYHHDLERLLKRFGKDTPYIGSGVSPTRGKEIERLWNAGRIPLLLGHPQSIGHGLNMQERGYHVAFHSLTWDYELYDQFIRRVRRQGNHRQTVFVHRIVARGTIDEVKIDALSRKEGCQSRFLDAMNSYRKSRGRK